MQKIHILYFLTFIIFTVIWIIYSENDHTIKIKKYAKDIFFISKTSKEHEQTKNETKSFDPEEQPPGDYARLVNLNNFQFLHSVQCTTNDKYPFLLITVHSAPGNAEQRKAIRETWGQKRDEIKVLFMMGVPQEEEDNSIIAEEQKIYNDIIQGNFKDSYKNLTYKHVMLLKYIVYHCSKIQYVLKTDDDVFINTPNVLMYISDYLTTQVKTTELIYCLPMFGSPAIRIKSKWKITFEEFPDEFYPPYCSGFAELFTTDSVFRIYRGAQMSKFLWVDDAFVTGVAREVAKIDITPFPTSLLLKYEEMQTIFSINNTYSFMAYSFLLGPANIIPQDIRTLWNIITHVKKQ